LDIPTATVSKVTNGNFRKPLSYDSPWFSQHVKDDLGKNARTQSVYEFEIDSRPYTVVIVGCGRYRVESGRDRVESDRKRERLIRRIRAWLLVLHTVKEPFVQPLVIYIFQSKLQKTLPQVRVTLGVEHVNSAFTAYCDHNHEYEPHRGPTEIIVYRKQEQFKVFVHETFHNYHADFCSQPNDAAYRRIRKLFGVGSKVLIHESYTETWATIINICFCCVELELTAPNVSPNVSPNASPKTTPNATPPNATPPSSDERLLEQFQLLIDQERMFAIQQMKKVLAHNGICYTDFVNDPLVAEQYREASNVLAYYIIKCILLFHYDRFIDWCREHNINWFCFDQSEKSSDFQHSFCGLIESLYKEKSFLSEVAVERESDEKMSLRMTLFGL
jgi:hypothetical protein